MPLDLIDGKSTLPQVVAWCHQATSHYLSQCWPRSLSPYGVIRPQWVNVQDWLLEAWLCHDMSRSALDQAVVCCLTAPTVANTLTDPIMLTYSQQHIHEWFQCIFSGSTLANMYLNIIHVFYSKITVIFPSSKCVDMMVPYLIRPFCQPYIVLWYHW